MLIQYIYIYTHIYTYVYMIICLYKYTHNMYTIVFYFAMLPSGQDDWPSMGLELFVLRVQREVQNLTSMFTSLLRAFEIASRLAPEMMCDESQLSDAPTELGSSQGPGVCSTISSDSMEVCAGWHGMSPLGQSWITSR